MPSRQERRKAERDAAKRAPAQAGAAGAGGPAAALDNLTGHPGGNWTTQASDPAELFREHGDRIVKRRVVAGDREAQFSLGYRLVSEEDVAADAGATTLGASGRSPKADVGSHVIPHSFPVFQQNACDASLWKTSQAHFTLEEQITLADQIPECGCQP